MPPPSRQVHWSGLAAGSILPPGRLCVTRRLLTITLRYSLNGFRSKTTASHVNSGQSGVDGDSVPMLFTLYTLSRASGFTRKRGRWRTSRLIPMPLSVTIAPYRTNDNQIVNTPPDRNPELHNGDEDKRWINIRG